MTKYMIPGQAEFEGETTTNNWQERTCNCADGHADQRAAYPLDAQVETVTAICCYGDVIPTGTRGSVVAHCEDGRAYVRFAEPYDVSGGHTFHFPEQNIRVVDTLTPATAVTSNNQQEATKQMLTTIYEIENGQRRWIWDAWETGNLEHLQQAFGHLVETTPHRYYEIEQNGKIVLTIKHDATTPTTALVGEGRDEAALTRNWNELSRFEQIAKRHYLHDMCDVPNWEYTASWGDVNVLLEAHATTLARVVELEGVLEGLIAEVAASDIRLRGRIPTLLANARAALAGKVVG